MADVKQMLTSWARSIGPVHRGINRLRGRRIHDATRRERSMIVVGSDYGGWAVLPDRLSAHSIVYAVGVGQDISFDLGLIEKFGCAVFAFDPTPKSLAWISTQTLPPRFHFHPVGLGATDGDAIFHAPSVEGHVSFSLTGANEAGAGQTVTCPIRRLSTIMRDLGHERIDLLKMDIEGFEYGVIKDMIASGIRPEQLQVEFHHTMYAHSRSETAKAVSALRDFGYDLFWVSNVGHEYAFVAR